MVNHPDHDTLFENWNVAVSFDRKRQVLSFTVPEGSEAEVTNPWTSALDLYGAGTHRIRSGRK